MNVHIDDDALVRWLETGKPTSAGQHLEDCPSCLDRLDELTELGAGVRGELAEVTAPPGDLEHRTSGRVKDRLAAQEAVSFVVELFTLPWITVEALIDGSRPRRGIVLPGPPGHDDARDDRERRDG